MSEKTFESTLKRKRMEVNVAAVEGGVDPTGLKVELMSAVSPTSW